MQRFATGPVIFVLAAFAVYAFYIATRSMLTAEGYDPGTFWPSIVLIYVLGAVSAWFAFRLYRVRSARR